MSRGQKRTPKACPLVRLWRTSQTVAGQPLLLPPPQSTYTVYQGKNMTIKERIINLKERIKEQHLVLIFSAIYSFVWAVCKIVFGVISKGYFFCVSGASTLLLGFVKRMYLKNYANDDFELKKGKSITIAILIIISSTLFGFYMARLFFFDNMRQYGLIMSIAIAAFSFGELGIAIYNFVKAKKSNDILQQALRGSSLASSSFAITLTQVALLSAMETPAGNYNALTGLLASAFSIMVGVYLLTKFVKEVENKE